MPATILGSRRQSLSLGGHILGGIDIRHLTLSNRIKIVIDALKDTPVVLRGYDRGTEHGGPGVEPSPSTAGGGGSDPWSGSWGPTCPEAKRPEHKAGAML